jgi:hypothetical protein
MTKALAARELMRLAFAVGAELDEVERGPDLVPDLRFRQAAHLEPEGDVVGDVHVGKQRIVLKHHADLALLQRHALDALAVHLDPPGIGEIEAGNHPEQRRLARARGAEQRIEAAIIEAHRDVVERLVIAECAGEIHDLDACHYCSPPNL